MTKEEKFIEGLYDEAEEEMKQVYEKQKENEKELLKEIALIMLTYTVLEGVMSLSLAQRNKELTRLTKAIKKATKGQAELQEETILNILTNITGKTFKFYSYNKGLKDVRKIIEDNFKGKHFSNRVWENEEEKVSKYLQSQVKKFLDGKIGVNDIKKSIEKGFGASKYNAKRLVETEVNRCSSNAFDRFCKEAGVEKLRYNATLDSKLCSDCGQYHDKVFNLDGKIDVPRHPLCRCFYTIEDEYYKKDVSKIENSGIINNKEWLNANFPSEKKFKNHIDKHLNEYGEITSKEYLNISRELLSAPLSKDIEGFVSKEGFIFKYRKSTNDFTIGRADGKISTLFKPDEKIEYWKEQIELFSNKEE